MVSPPAGGTPVESRGAALLRATNPPLVLAAGIEALAGSLAGGAELLEPAPYLVAGGGAALLAAGSLFGAYYAHLGAPNKRPLSQAPPGPFRPGDAWPTAWVLLAVGLLLSAIPGTRTLTAAVALALTVCLYAAFARRMWGASFLCLGAARAVNLLLGLAATEQGLPGLAIAAVPVALHAVAWGLLRASRQPGAPPTTGFASLVHLAAAASVLLYQLGAPAAYRLDAAPFVVLYVAVALPAWVRAVLEPRREHVAVAVQYGFLALPLLEAALVALHAGGAAGTLIALLVVPLYRLLARWPIPLRDRRQ
jgi:hypothetical protein